MPSFVYVAIGFAALFGLLIYYVKKSERKSVKLDEQEEKHEGLVEDVKEAQKIRRDISNLSDDELNKLL